jgi:hypothetical protein
MLYLLLIFLVFLVFIVFFASINFYNIIFRGFAPFISTKFEAILTILKDLNLNGDETVYELGAGKAGFLRAVEERFGNKKLVGIEYSFFPYLIAKIQLSLLNSSIELVRKNIFKVNLKKADIIYCFLNIEMMEKLEEKVKRECRKGTILISYHFKFPNVEEEKVLKEGENNIYFYRI